jgi:hypothetical protein
MNGEDSIKWPNLIELHTTSHKWDEADAELYYLEQLERFKEINPHLKRPELEFARHILDNTPKALPTKQNLITVKRLVNQGKDEEGKTSIEFQVQGLYSDLDEMPQYIRSFVEEQREIAQAQYNFRQITRVVIGKLLQDPSPQARQLVSTEFDALQAEVRELREAVEEARGERKKWTIEEQIVCLHELGIIQALKKKNPSSENAIAKAIAPALNQKHDSIQPKLNKYFKPERQSEILTPERVDKVKKEIEAAGINSI